MTEGSNDSINESKATEAAVRESNSLTKGLNKYVEFSHGNHLNGIVQYMTTELNKSNLELGRYYRELNKYKTNFITTAIASIVSNDVFVTSGNDEFVDISVKDNPELTEELKNLFNDFNLYNLIPSIFSDMLHYGGYPLSAKTKRGKGIISISDEFTPDQVIPVSNGVDYPLFYFVNVTEKRDTIYWDYASRQTYKFRPVNEIIYFSLGLEPLRLKIPEKMYKQMKNKTPDELTEHLPETFKINMPKSYIWGCLDKLKDILLHDKISSYRNISDVLEPKIVGVPLPDAYEASDLIEIVQKYEELLNGSAARFNDLENLEITLKDITSVKVVPVSGDKSIPSPIDTKSRYNDSSEEKLNSKIENLLNSLGIPLESYFGRGERGSNLKSNVRHSKNIKKIQKSLATTIKHICLLHIASKYTKKFENITEEDIVVNLKNNTNLDELENLESFDLTLSSLKSAVDLMDLLKGVNSGEDYVIDANEFMKQAKDALASIGSNFQNIIKRVEES